MINNDECECLAVIVINDIDTRIPPIIESHRAIGQGIFSICTSNQKEIESHNRVSSKDIRNIKNRKVHIEVFDERHENFGHYHRFLWGIEAIVEKLTSITRCGILIASGCIV